MRSKCSVLCCAAALSLAFTASAQGQELTELELSVEDLDPEDRVLPVLEADPQSVTRMRRFGLGLGLSGLALTLAGLGVDLRGGNQDAAFALSFAGANLAIPSIFLSSSVLGARVAGQREGATSRVLRRRGLFTLLGGAALFIGGMGLGLAPNLGDAAAPIGTGVYLAGIAMMGWGTGIFIARRNRRGTMTTVSASGPGLQIRW